MALTTKIQLPDSLIEEMQEYIRITQKPNRTTTGQASFTNFRTSATYTTTGSAYDNQGEQGLGLLLYNVNPNLKTYVFDVDAYNEIDNEKANLDGGNVFTGDQSITNGSQIITNGAIYHKQAGGTANKRGFIWSLFSTSYYLSAINDVGEIVRNIIEFIHDGGVSLKAIGGIVGGRLTLEKPESGTNISGSVAIDVAADFLRIFETGGSQRGAYIPVTLMNGGIGNRLLTDADQNELRINDYRSNNWTPEQWYTNGNGTSTTSSMITCSTIGLPGSWANVITNAPWVDASVGVTQMAFICDWFGTPSGQVYLRHAEDVDMWSPWTRLSQDTGWKTVTLATGSWGTNADGKYRRFYQISDADFAIGDAVEFEVGAGLSDSAQRAQVDNAENAGMANYALSGYNSRFYFLSESAPSVNLTVKYRINKG